MDAEPTRQVLAARIDQRWAAVRALIEAETELRTEPHRRNRANYQMMAQSLSLLTHPHETGLRTALRYRTAAATGPDGPATDDLLEGWWHPWAAEWASQPDIAKISAQNDYGYAF